MADAQLAKGRDRGEMDELKKLILSEKARTKHHADAGGGGGAGGMARRTVDGGDNSDDDGEEDPRERADARARPGAKEKKKQGTWRRGKLILANDDDDLNKYRDRAEERRKGHNPDYADKLNQMASMDAETSKYLGGDVEHTHLVKGLDYALLVKIREEGKQRQMELDYEEGKDGEGGNRRGMRAEVRARTLMGKTVLAVLRKLHTGQGAGGPDFKRVGYEFDLDAESTQEIPTAVAHSKDDDDEEEEEDRERHTNYLMEEDLLERVEQAFTLFRQHGGKARRHRKRAREKNTGAEEDAIVSALANTGSGRGNDDAEDDADMMDIENGSAARKAKVSIDIFEDVTDRYVPPDDAAAAISAATGGSAASKGYFSGLRAAKTNESDKKGADMPTRAEMSATVKAAARAAAARLAGGDKRQTSVAGGGGGGGADGGSKRIERDIFAARPSRGQALGVEAGGYDVYPETGDFETYDSDEDATNKKGAKPGGDGGGATTKGGDLQGPKASFPFGVKKSEMSGRTGGGGKGNKHRVDNELNRINKVMKGGK